ncbi:type IV pilin [Natrialbaceae archaeon AArc-T1-2]|uniref:type IV pilin n=1 Tax=Natrialbaceae archaeon AArc-T1-2 TaxID=3053904 RepID=UPI003D2F5FCB
MTTEHVNMLDGKKVTRKLVGSEDERAVSPVIGVILMVAITVILAAVIAAFVLDLGDSIDSEAQAGVSVDNSVTDAETQVTWQSEGNSERVTINITLSQVDDTGEATAEETLDSVGDSVTFDAENYDEWVDDSDYDPVEGEGDESVAGEVVVTAETDEGVTTVVSSDTVEWEDAEVDDN